MNNTINQPWQVQMLGGLHVQRGEYIIERFRTHQAGELLAYLALRQGQRVARTDLIDLLWSNSNSENKSNLLSTALSWLRREMEPKNELPAGAVIDSTRVDVCLRAEAIRTDVQDLRRAIQRARHTGSEAERRLHIKRAAELFTGELLPGYQGAWVLGARADLTQPFVKALREVIKHLEEDGELEEAVAYAAIGLRVDPSCEESYCTYIRLLAAMGRISEGHEQCLLMKRMWRKNGEDLSAATEELCREISRRRRNQKASLPFPSGIVVSQPTVPLCLPSGTVTFLAVALQECGMGDPTAIQGEALQVFSQYGGNTLRKGPDLLLVAFESARDALAGAITWLRTRESAPLHLVEERPQETDRLLARMGLHTADVRPDASGHYPSAALDLATRVSLAAHSGQILCSQATSGLLLQDTLKEMEPGVRLKNLGSYQLLDTVAPGPLYQINYSGMPRQSFGSPQAPPTPHLYSLPVPLSRFVGRANEVAELEEWLRPGGEVRLVTLAGPAGIGKTRLALAAARRVNSLFAGAVWFVPSEGLSNPNQLPGAILSALHMPVQPEVDLFDQVVGTLEARPSLLVLDNLEHLVDGGEDLVHALLERLPMLICMITSRRLLGVEGEHVFSVSPLPVPSDVALERLRENESMRLFVDRARAARLDFQLTKFNAPVLAELCERLEGIPLALELAAARIPALTPVQLVEHLTYRFALLKSRTRDVAGRHRSLQAALDCSYDLLTPDLKSFFCQLSVFRGGWTLEAAAAVTGESYALDKMQELIAWSLIFSEDEVGTDSYGAGARVGRRFRMLETIREYAVEQLARGSIPEADMARTRHHTFYVDLAERARPSLFTREQMAWAECLEREGDNLSAVFNEAEDGSWAPRLAGALWPLWLVRDGLRTGGDRLTATLAYMQNMDMLPDSLADTWAGVITGAAVFAYFTARFAEAGHLARQGLVLAHVRGDEWLAGICMIVAGIADENEGKVDLAEAWYAKALASARTRDDGWLASLALGNLGYRAFYQGAGERACALLDEGLRLARDVGETYAIIYALFARCLPALVEGDLNASRAYLKESMQRCRAIRYRLGVAISLVGFGFLALSCDEARRTATLLGAAEAAAEGPLPPGVEVFRVEFLAEARRRLNATESDCARIEGGAMSWEQAAAFALEVTF